MQDSERFYIEKCKTLIEETLRWKESRFWTQRDYEYLRESIFQKTGTLLSISTLKRLWKTESGLPHPSTLNALAMFLDYADWHVFKRECCEDVAEAMAGRTSSTRAGWRKRALDWILIIRTRQAFTVGIALVFIVVGVVTSRYLFHRLSENPFDDVIFTSQKVVTNGVPNTIIFNYDVSMLDTDSIEIQQSWDIRKRAKVSKDNHQHTSVYHYPGYHRAKLVVDGEIIREHHVHITTDGWLGTAVTQMWQDYPVYLRDEAIMESGRLYSDPDLIRQRLIDSGMAPYAVLYWNVSNFGEVDGDNFTIETQVKNDIAEGGLVGQYAQLVVLGQGGRTILPLTIPGCVGNIDVKFQDVWIRGRENDLSSFGCDMSEWNRLKCRIRDKHAEIYLNDQLIREVDYERSAGRVVGLLYTFLGCGSVDFIRMYDADGNLVYDDDFG